MNPFHYAPLPWNIIFGVGAVNRLPEELGKLGLENTLVLSTPEQVDSAREIDSLLGEQSAGIFSEAKMHVPRETVDLAIAKVHELRADCTVSLGGGSTTGLGKALALELDLPNIAIPTTYAGSEMTNIWGITENSRKVTGRNNKVVPSLTIYDPELSLSLPARIAAPSGLNAMSQAVVNLTSGELNPMVSLMALEAVRALADSLPKIIHDPQDIEARSAALFGASLAGASLGTGTTSLHHRLCHTFGGSFNTPHAETHTVLLPHCVAYNSVASSDGTAKLAQALGASNAAQALLDLAKRTGAPTTLEEIGVKESDLSEAARIATETPMNNPEPVTTARVEALLRNAWRGSAPEAV